MATGGDQTNQINMTFAHFVKVSNVGKTLSEEQKKEITDKGMNKMLKECCGDAIAKVAESQVFTAVARKAKHIKLDVFHSTFLPELATVLVLNERQKKDRAAKKPDKSDAAVVAKLEKLKKDIAAKHGTATKTAAVNDVTKRLTDTKGYTGAHKERFDDSGKGKGIDGREERADGSGYVTGYDNAGTYEKK